MENFNINAIIESITCPITQMPMTDPVQGKDGHTYERSAIIQALQNKQESPITREFMTVNDLKVNSSIRFLCDKYHSGEFGSTVNTQKITTKSETHNTSIIIDHNISKSIDSKYIMLEFEVNKESFPKDLACQHLSQDIVLVIDRSGSMNSPVEAKDANNNNIENGMSIQDIVNHAAKTIAKSLDKNSRLAIIAFDNEIVTIFDLMFMNEVNKTNAMINIDTIKPRYQTNIWGGIEKAIQILDDRDDKTRNSAILMLTDGSPNISPARGEVETLKKLRIKNNFNTPIYTFGFGYNLQRELLYNLAKYGNGGNGHIPDGGLIATVFCNFSATILCTVAMNLQIHIITPNITLMGDYAFHYDEIKEETVYDIGTLQYEQIRNIVLNVPECIENIEYYYTYNIGNNSYNSQQINKNLSQLEVSPNIDVNINRYSLVESIRTMINYNNINLNSDTLNEYAKIEKQLISSKLTDKLSAGMLKNLKGDSSNEGQIKLAVTNMVYFKRWGEFYLDQLSRSLNQQIKPNFKDESCVFGGKVFENCVDSASDIFDTLPPPKPSLIPRTQLGSNYNSMNYRSMAAPIDMSSYNNSSGGCFDSNCTITMADGSIKSLKSIKKGDNIKSMDNNNNINVSKVICVVETFITKRVRNMVNIDGLVITPWHPIKIKRFNNYKWVFPNDIKEENLTGCISMITLVLDKYHIGFINNIACIMLGHNYKEGILDHPYYGTNKVIDDLKKNFNNEYINGHITLNDNEIDFLKKDNITKSINFNISKPLIKVV